MASIALRNIAKVFDHRVAAVAALTLDVHDGELMVVVGPSGCGKTTILRLVAGLESPTSGEIRIGDRLVNDVPPRERDIAMVCEDAALYPHMSVSDNLAFAPRMRGLPKEQVRRRVRSAAEMLGIVDLMARRPAALSAGQRQRVALGRAIVREPAVFLFDEPLTSLDAGLRLMMRAEIKALHQRLRTTMLYVTHDQSEAMALGDRICVLRDGRMQQTAPPREIYDRPVNRFVAGFFGVPPMNFLTGRLRLDGGASFVDVATVTLSLPGFLQSRLAAHPASTVIVGIRPHDLSLEPLPGQKDNVLSARVRVVEPLGSRTDVHVSLASGENCIASGPSHYPLKTGAEVHLYVNLDKLQIFEAGEPGLRFLSTSTTES